MHGRSSSPGPRAGSAIDALVDSLIDAGDLQGISPYETSVLQRYRQRARLFLEGFAWCSDLRAERFAAGAAGIAALFAMEVLVKGTTREWLWVIAGELPSAYVPLVGAPGASQAMGAYCELIERWIDDRERGPCSLEATAASPRHLESQLRVLRGYLIPALCGPEAAPSPGALPSGLVISLEPSEPGAPSAPEAPGGPAPGSG